MANAEHAHGRRPESAALTRVVVELARPDRGNGSYRIEEPDRVLRMWCLLKEVAEEPGIVALPPESEVRVQRLLTRVSEELERAVSPDLADELHRLLGWGETGPDVTHVRVAYASLLGWAGGLAVGMLNQIESAAEAPAA